jgi:DNA-binding MarR family transcriptional regulator
VLKGYRQLVEVLSAAHRPEFPDPSVTMAQMRVLMLLGAVGEARMSDLAAKLGTSLSSLSSVVDRLVEADLARRREDARDRRSVLISLAPAGNALLDNFQELGERHLRELLDELSDEAITTVSQAIDLLVAAARRLAQKEPA